MRLCLVLYFLEWCYTYLKVKLAYILIMVRKLLGSVEKSGIIKIRIKKWYLCVWIYSGSCGILFAFPKNNIYYLSVKRPYICRKHVNIQIICMNANFEVEDPEREYRYYDVWEHNTSLGTSSRGRKARWKEES